jgi:hypothetical protein
MGFPPFLFRWQSNDANDETTRTDRSNRVQTKPPPPLDGDWTVVTVSATTPTPSDTTDPTSGGYAVILNHADPDRASWERVAVWCLRARQEGVI